MMMTDDVTPPHSPPTSIKASFEDYITTVFEINERKTTIHSEIFCGVIQFISCMYVLPVIPLQLANSGYNRSSTVCCVSLTCALGCMISGYLSNLPFIIAPPAAISIYLSAFIRRRQMLQYESNNAVMLSGAILLFIGFFKPVGYLIKKLIPTSIEISTVVGTGLITALAGAVDVNLVIKGSFSILSIGELFQPQIVISIVSIVLSAVSMTFHVKGAFIIGLLAGTCLWYAFGYGHEEYDKFINGSIFQSPTFSHISSTDSSNTGSIVTDNVLILASDLIFLFVILLNGLCDTLADLANLKNADGKIERGNWIFVVTGMVTILSGFFSGPPVLLSPESSAGIKSNAKTGLSTFVCGILFFFSLFVAPLFEAIPFCATTPLLILVGMILFQNVSKLDWNDPQVSVSSFFVIFLIPFTYSIISGVTFGFLFYISIGTLNGSFYQRLQRHMNNQTSKNVSPTNYCNYSSIYYSTDIIINNEEVPSTNEDVRAKVSRRRSNSFVDKVFPMDL